MACNSYEAIGGEDGIRIGVFWKSASFNGLRCISHKSRHLYDHPMSSRAIQEPKMQSSNRHYVGTDTLPATLRMRLLPAPRSPGLPPRARIPSDSLQSGPLRVHRDCRPCRPAVSQKGSNPPVRSEVSVARRAGSAPKQQRFLNPCRFDLSCFPLDKGGGPSELGMDWPIGCGCCWTIR